MIIKKPLTINDQITRLTSRGLILETQEDRDDLALWLKNVGYYRLSGYWWVYELKYPNVSPRNHLFVSGTTWKQVKHTYIFDQKFRKHMFTGIEKIEVAMKALWAQYLSETYNTSHPHERRNLFKENIYHHNNTYSSLLSSYKSSKEPYAMHYRNKYPELTTPPIWVVTLLLTLGEFLNWLKYLAHTKDKKAILKDFPYTPSDIISILNHLRWVRNVCAHNGRLWNKRTPISFSAPKSRKNDLVYSSNSPNKLDTKIYNTILVMSDMLKIIDPNYPFTYFIKDMISKNLYINPLHMGFPQDWESLPYWETPIPEHKYHKKQKGAPKK